MSDPREEIRNFDIPNPFRTKMVTDFEFCKDRVDLGLALRSVDRNGYRILCVTQDGGTYTVFFRRPAP